MKKLLDILMVITMSNALLFLKLLIVGILTVTGVSLIGLLAYSGFVLTHTSNPDDLLIIWFLFPRSLGIVTIGGVLGAIIGYLRSNWTGRQKEKPSDKNSFMFIGEAWGSIMFSTFYWLWEVYQYSLSQFFRP